MKCQGYRSGHVAFSPLLRLAVVAVTTAVSLILAGIGNTSFATEVKFSDTWALQETFDGNPASPSQADLPRNFEYVATHRTHPQDHFSLLFPAFRADHANNCDGPDPAIVPLPQHMVVTTQNSNSNNPDPSFYICRGHIMSSMGEVAAYSNTVFWPRQEFDFSQGGTLEFDVSMKDGHTQRHWWEVLITPREQLKFAAAPQQSAVDEPYPKDRIVLDFREQVRHVRVGENAFDPAGWTVQARQFAQFDYAYWNALYPTDPALADGRIRRKMRIQFESNQIIWGIQTAAGTFDDYAVEVPGGLPFNRGVVQFKTHAYTPATSGGNLDVYTFHWDNVRFTGPVVGTYQAHHTDQVVYLQRDGNRPIGDEQSVTIQLPDSVLTNPVLVGQMHGSLRGQALVSINGRPEIAVEIDDYSVNGCVSGEWRDWVSFRLPLNPAWLNAGSNTLSWRVGPRPACATNGDWWNGYSVKFLHIQTDGDPNAPGIDSIFASGFEDPSESVKSDSFQGGSHCDQ